jgi:hypothetical protein
VGFAAGAYVATVAHQRSRQLNQQLNQKVNRTWRKTAIDAAAEKAKAAVELGVERARDVVANKLAGEQGLIRPVIQAPSRLAARQRDSVNGDGAAGGNGGSAH